jgi:hypothetical protein
LSPAWATCYQMAPPNQSLFTDLFADRPRKHRSAPLKVNAADLSPQLFCISGDRPQGGLQTFARREVMNYLPNFDRGGGQLEASGNVTNRSIKQQPGGHGYQDPAITSAQGRVAVKSLAETGPCVAERNRTAKRPPLPLRQSPPWSHLLLRLSLAKTGPSCAEWLTRLDCLPSVLCPIPWTAPRQLGVRASPRGPTARVVPHHLGRPGVSKGEVLGDVG